MSSILLTGYIWVPDDHIETVLNLLPEHITLTRQEPGCLLFEVVQHSEIPNRFDVTERFEDQQAFDAHQQRAGESKWARATVNVKRHYQIKTV